MSLSNRSWLGSSCFSMSTLLDRRLRTMQIEYGVDDADVAERLREVSKHAPRLRVVLL